MAITAVSQTLTGTALSWGDFTIVAPPLVDPADGATIDAHTAFGFALNPFTPVGSGGSFKLPDPAQLVITPIAQVTNTTAHTAALLSHEAFHYDVGFVIARVVAKRLMRIEKPTAAEVMAEARSITAYHFTTRAGLIQSRYDKDTHHGTVARYQRMWKSRMTACLADPNATQLGGFML